MKPPKRKYVKFFTQRCAIVPGAWTSNWELWHAWLDFLRGTTANDPLLRTDRVHWAYALRAVQPKAVRSKRHGKRGYLNLQLKGAQ